MKLTITDAIIEFLEILSFITFCGVFLSPIALFFVLYVFGDANLAEGILYSLLGASAFWSIFSILRWIWRKLEAYQLKLLQS